MFSFLCRQEALLAAISEKDANIALLELSSSKKKTQEEVAALKREKDRLVQQLKQQVLVMPRAEEAARVEPMSHCPFKNVFITVYFLVFHARHQIQKIFVETSQVFSHPFKKKIIEFSVIGLN